jgi:hypothetical protein
VHFAATVIHNLQLRSSVARLRAINLVLALTVLGVPSPLFAQLVVDPTTAVFEASSSHSATDANGNPIVTRYDLEFFHLGAAQPFQVQPFGKPAPVDGTITVSLASILVAFPTPGIVYESAVAAVGPGGAARSARSNTFQFSTPACTYGVSPSSATLTSAAGSSTTAVTAASGCAWTATSSAAWLTITGGASGSGNGTVTFSATANTATSQRSGTLTVAGQAVTVTQNGAACTFGVSPTSRSFTAAGGASTTAVTAGTGCAWTATSAVAWLTITGGATGSGNGTVTFSASTNASASQRSGSLTVAGQTVSVTQSGSSCTFGLSPTTRSFTAAGGSSTTLVIVTGGGSSCAWTASSNATWLTITAGASGTGNATVTFSAASNPTAASRTGTLTVAGRTLTVTQSAGTPTAPSTPTNLRFVPTSQ